MEPRHERANFPRVCPKEPALRWLVKPRPADWKTVRAFGTGMDFARVQILSQELIRQIDEQAANIPEKEIEEYYHRHFANFENATLERIISSPCASA